MILVDEAVQRYADSAGRYGCNPRRNRQPGDIVMLLNEVDRLLPGDLRVPRELRDFWADWNPSTFGLALGDGLPTVERTLMEWEGSRLPNILLLVCSIQNQSIYLEMESDAHPGMRLYYADGETNILEMWGLGIVGLLDVMGATYQRTQADPEGPYNCWVDPVDLHQVAHETADQILADPTEKRIDVSRPESWPEHWRLADGMPAGAL